MPEGLLLLNSQLSSKDVKAIRAALKAAYQRGREDAAKAVREQCREIPLTTASHVSFMYLTAIAAARGDGEQA